MARVEKTISIGNILSIITTLIAVAAAVIGITMHVGGIQEEMRTSGAKHEIRIERLERDMKRTEADHDLLIEIRQNVLALRAIVEKRASAEPTQQYR